jgi:2-keto-4-pentenoate hydratase/2-oxohepta-3-ene-1,7-dioic acid hydratase in catechol pathway
LLSGFAFGTFSVAATGARFVGIVVNDRVIPLSAFQEPARKLGVELKGAGTLQEWLQDWDRNLTGLLSLLDEEEGLGPGCASSQALDVSSLQVHAPLEPRQILCSGANYRKHVIDLVVAGGGGPENEHLSPEERRALAEQLMDERARRGTPYLFPKLPSSVTGPFDSIILPGDVRQPDWELELAVVLGRPARRVARSEALRYVAGYTIANDITARDHVFRRDVTAMGTDWLASKSRPTFTPLGPHLVPARFVENPQALQITLKVNGQPMQNESTADMIFDVARLVEFASGLVQLWPGDVILTGSPAGNGAHYGRYLQPGDVVESAITHLGAQRNVCVAEGS